MELKFSFSESEELPFSTAPTASSSELYVDLPDSEGELKAIAVSGDGVEYAKATRERRENEEFSTAVRSVLARVIAELGDPLSSSITEIRVGAQVHLALQSLEAVDESGTQTTTVLERRAGVKSKTPVQLVLST